MTVEQTTSQNRNSYQGNGSTTVFNFTFVVLKESNQALNRDYTIEVIITEDNVETIKQENTDYTVQLGENGLGTITFATAPTITQAITFLSSIPLSQSTDYINIGSDKFPADSHEKTVDKLTLILREQDEKIDRAILADKSSNISNITIPISLENKDKAIVVNSTGDNLDAKNLADIGIAPITDFAKTLLDDSNSQEARNTLDVYSKAEAEQKANLLTEKTSVVNGDKFIIADSQDNNNSKKLDFLNLTNAIQLPEATSLVKGITFDNEEIIKISNNATNPLTEIDITAGVMKPDDRSKSIYFDPTVKTRSIANDFQNGGLLYNGATVLPDTMYYVFAIYSTGSNVVNFYADIDETGLNIPQAPNVYGKKQYRGAFYVDASSNIKQGKYSYYSDFYEFDKQKPNTIDRVLTAMPTTATLQSITAPTNSKAKLNIFVSSTAVHQAIFYPTNSPNTIPSVTNYSYRIATGTTQALNFPLEVEVDNNSQIIINSSSAQLVEISTKGWKENL